MTETADIRWKQRFNSYRRALARLTDAVNMLEQRSLSGVTLHGSRAKGSFHPGSDIDLSIQAPQMRFADLVRIEA